MAVYIDSETGLTADSTAEIRAKLVEAWETVFNDENATLNTESESPAGQLIDSQAVSITAKDSELLELFNNFNPKVASGIFQEALCSIYYMERKKDIPTVVTCQVTGLQGTVIPRGSLIMNDDGYRLQSIENITIGTNGSATGEFECITSGAIAIGAGTCNKIITVIAGWDSIRNETAGATGQEIETRAEMEARRRQSVAKNAHGTRLALQGALYALDGVIDCLVLENRTSASTTKKGVTLTSHSVAVCIYGGNDTDIAETIYNKLGAGCDTNGGTTVVYTSEDGTDNEYLIIRPTPTNIYIQVQINLNSSTPANIIELIKQAVYNDFVGLDVNSGNVRRGCGQDIYASSFSVCIIKTAGVTDLVAIGIGLNDSSYTNVVTVNADEEPIITKENISVVIAS